MVPQGDEIERLSRATRHDLTAVAFPPRRDLEWACLAAPGDPERTVFHEAFWPRPDRLGCLVVRVGGGARGCLAAHALRALLRAALRLHPAETALTLSLAAFARSTPDIAVDAAVGLVCARTGEAGFAAHGVAEAGRTGGDDRARLAVGEAAWLTVGEVAVPAATHDEASDATDLVRDAVAGATDAAAAVLRLRGLRPPGERTFVLANDVAEISPLLAEVLGFLATAGLAPDLTAGLEVALDEHLTNVLLYAYADGGAHEVFLRVHLAGAALRIVIEDDGTPFDPTTGSAPDLDASLEDRPLGGLGLHLIGTVFDGVAYERVRGWNVLTLTKSLADAADPGRTRGPARTHAPRTPAP